MDQDISMPQILNRTSKIMFWNAIITMSKLDIRFPGYIQFMQHKFL